jgi:hypothetical protein
MARKPKEYVRLRGQNRAIFAISGVSRCSLWAARDHLLYIANEGYTEEYRRFYYKDIQAMLVRKTVAGPVGTAILSILTACMLLWLLYGLSEAWHWGGLLALGIVTSFFLIPLLVNILKGPTCATYIRTAVQTEQVHSLSRLRTAMKVIRQLRETIEGTQGRFTVEHVARMEEEVARLEEEDALKKKSAQAAAQSRAAAQPLKPYRGKAHQVLFVVLLADFCHNCLQFHVTDPNLYLVAATLAVAIVAATVVALIKQFRTTLWPGIKAITWVALPYLVVLNFVSNMCFLFYSFANPGTARSSLEVYRAMYGISPFDSELRMAIVIIGMIGSGGLGLTGLLMFNRFRQSQAIAAEQEPGTERGSPTEQPAAEAGPEPRQGAEE